MIIRRFNHGNTKEQFLILIEKEVIKEGKNYPSHDLDYSTGAGNGHHGYCSRCGDSLTSYLGGGGWVSGSEECKVDDEITVNIEYRWTKNKNKATDISHKKMSNIWSNLLNSQPRTIDAWNFSQITK